MTLREGRVNVEGRWLAEVFVGARVVAEGHDHVVGRHSLRVLAVGVEEVLAIEVCIHVVEGLCLRAVVGQGLLFCIRNKLPDQTLEVFLRSPGAKGFRAEAIASGFLRACRCVHSCS